MFCSHTTFPVCVWCLVKVKYSCLDHACSTSWGNRAVHSSSLLMPSALSKLRHVQELKGRMVFCLFSHSRMHSKTLNTLFKTTLWKSNFYFKELSLGCFFRSNYQEAFCIIVFNSQCTLNMVLAYLF